MTLRELKKIVDMNVEHLPDYSDPNVVVAIKGSGIGGTNCVKVRTAYCGFDWDAGKFILHTEGRLLESPKDKTGRLAEAKKNTKKLIDSI